MIPETSHRTPEVVPGRADSIYFLMFPGWRDELRSNRWHYARRWARYIPVVLVQPERRVRGGWVAAKETRIPNVEVLSICVSARPPTLLKRSFAQTAQIMEHMLTRGYERPILWGYNPWLVGAYAGVPAIARVYHATENYFDFDAVDEFFLDAKSIALASSDLVVAVSDGVAASVALHAAPDRIAVITNGCDLEDYSADGPTDAELEATSAPFNRTAIYAGNVNGRLDFRLVERLADEHPRTLFAIFGPVAELNADDGSCWRQLIARSNLKYFGAVPPDRLAALYRTADVGIIPYKRTPWLIRNGFPLKALEMGATGLPAVASRMEPLRGVADALVVTEDDDAFASAFLAIERGTLNAAQRTNLATVCAANDYDRKFEEVLRLVGTLEVGGPATRVDPLISHLEPAEWMDLCSGYARSFASMRAAAYGAAYRAVGQLLPGPVRRAIPKALRDRARRRLAH